MADYAIHEETLSGIANVIRKKEGSSTLIDPADYAERINLMGMLEEKTVSGSVVTFSDGSDDVPLKKCEVEIPANLDGISSVDVVQTGKNLLLSGATSDTINGLTFTVNSDGSVTVNGTASANTAFVICNVYLKAGSYILSGAPPTGISTTYEFQVLASNGTTYREYGSGRTFTLAEGTDGLNEVRILIRKNYVANNLVFYPQLELGSTASAYEPINGTTHTANLGRTIYGGEIDVVNGTGTDENGNDFTFTPVPILSRLGDNTMWGDSGDSEIVYRSSGTQTLIPPTLISKTITANGTYSAEDDGADGYDEVTVNVSGGAQNIETVLSSNPLIEVSGVSGTDVTRTMWTYTASASGKIVFHSNTQVKTNTGANDGYFTVKKNDTVIATTHANTSTTTSLVVPDIDIVSGDVVTVECGFDNYHTSAWFDIYSTITILTESAPSLLMGGFGLSNSEEENSNSEEEEAENESD